MWLALVPLSGDPAVPPQHIGPPSLPRAGGQGGGRPIQRTSYFCVAFLKHAPEHTDPLPLQHAAPTTSPSAKSWSFRQSKSLRREGNWNCRFHLVA